MKTRLSGFKMLGSIVTAAIVALVPLMAQADGAQTTSVTSQTAQSKELAGLKHKLFLCNQHKKHRRAVRRVRTTAVIRAAQQPTIQVIEKTTIIEKPVFIEKIVEKQVFIERPLMPEKQVIVERAVELDRRVVVEHAKTRKHLLRFGIPCISVTLF